MAVVSAATTASASSGSAKCRTDARMRQTGWLMSIRPDSKASGPCRRARATSARRPGGDRSAGGDRRVVDDERGLQRAVFGTGELDGDGAASEAGQRERVQRVAGVVVEVGERPQDGAVRGDGQLVELRGGGRFCRVDV